MDYGKAIRICRAAFGLTQAELAARLSIGPSQISLIESGKRNPSQKAVDNICKALGIPRTLLTLLASSPQDLEQFGDVAVAELARKLLFLLVEAEVQQELLFEGNALR